MQYQMDAREVLEIGVARGNVARTVIFDFDGTIADSLEVGLRVVNALANDFGLPLVTRDTINRWHDLSSKEILKEIKLPFFRLPLMIRRFKRELNREIPSMKPFEGMDKALHDLKAQGCRLGIVSSNSEENIRAFLAAQGMSHLFDFVVSCPRLMGKDKALKKLMKQHQIHPETVLYVGDETRDVDAAKRSNVRSAAVAWGFNSVKVLAQHRPDFVLTEPGQLSQVVVRF
jgi:phosphoglycolate phosphatase